MRIPKTKPTIGRKEPYLCVNHNKRLAVVTRNGEDLCRVCWILEILAVSPHDWIQQARLLRWQNHYEALGQ